MKTQIVGLKGQAKERISTNDEIVTAFFREMTLLQRIEPVLTELATIILESRNAPDRQSALPRYCGNILRIFRRTYSRRCQRTAWTVAPRFIGSAWGKSLALERARCALAKRNCRTC